MEKHSKSLSERINDFWGGPPTREEKYWNFINIFYHLALTYMKKEGLNRNNLAEKLGVSRSSVSHMFNKTPNVTVKKMIDIADAIGFDLVLDAKQLNIHQKEAKTIIKPVYILTETWSEFIVKGSENNLIDPQKATGKVHNKSVKTETSHYLDN